MPFGRAQHRDDPTDPKDEESRVEIRDFGGFVTAMDPHDLPPGVSQEQVNATSVRPGELRVRGGFRVLRFDPS
jgi:hypothetical protein